MKKEEKILRKKEISFLDQLINSLKKAELRLEKAYKKKNYDSFNEAKKLILEIQKKISNVLK